MALGITTQLQRPQPPGRYKEAIIEQVFGASYANEGETLNPSAFGLRAFAAPPRCYVLNGSENEAEFPVDTAYMTVTGGGVGGFGATAGKIHLLNSKTSKEVVAGKNTEKVKAMVVAYGW